MSFAQLWGVLRASRWSILLMMLVAMAVAYVFGQSLPKEYVAKARVLLDIGNTDPTQYSSLRKDSVDSYMSTAMRLVGDPGVTMRVVDQLGWAENPAVIDAWQQSTGGAVELRSWAASRVLGNLSANQLQDSAVIEIYYSAGSPDVAKQIVGLIRSAYIANSQQLRIEAAARAAKWNRAQAAAAKTALERAEKARIDFAKANNIVLDNHGITTEMAALDESIQQAGKPDSKQLLPTAAPSPTMIYIQQQLNQADAAVALLAQRGPSNPDYLMALTRQQALRGQLERASADARQASGALAGATQEMRARADRDYVKARLAVLDQAPTYDHLLDLERAVAMKQRLYDAAKLRADQFDLIAAAPANLKIVGDVIGDDEPAFPNVPLITGIAATFGLALGVALALFGEMVNHRVRSSEDLAISSKVPVLAVIRSGSVVTRMRRWSLRRRSSGFQPAE